MKMYRLKTENFIFEFELNVYDKDKSIPINSILSLRLESDGFTASSSFDIDIKDFCAFVKNLKNLYNSLNGVAKLEDFHNYIEFSGNGNGYIKVNGVINSNGRNGFEQELHFENEFDQTYLLEFSDRLFKDFIENEYL